MGIDRIATYRIQLTPSFGFDAARAIIPDLVRLGVSHLYLSPVAEAVGGSTHGYDVVDPTSVRTELGGDDALHALAQAARDHGLGIIVDIVPNHVSTVEPERNAWWWELLREGVDAATATFFDVDWDLTGGRVLLPVLGEPLEQVIADGDLTVDGDRVRYHERSFPLRRNSSGPGTDLAGLLERQHYRLDHWRSTERNVRRFFTIDDLVAIRPEIDAVADAVHHIVAELHRAGLLDGVRIDHVDGLADPAGYLAALRDRFGDAWVLVEKIVVGDERLPASWPVDGTTGYEWIVRVDHLFTHPDGERTITDLWETMSGDHRAYHDVEADGIRHVLQTALRPDLRRVARVAGTLIGADPVELESSLIELTVHLGRYRTYLRSTDGAHPEFDHEAALVRAAGEHVSDPIGADLVDAIVAGNELTQRWQQLTGPALAKGGEDRALYRWCRLAAHNEVGGDPGRWSIDIDEFHRANEVTLATTPSMLLAGSTHDTKRSEDARARLLVLGEIPDRWRAEVESWSEMIDPPDSAAALFALQTVVAAWPIDAGRLEDYLIKAAREADEHTSWIDPDGDYEGALRAVAHQLTDEPLRSMVAAFVDEIDPGATSVSLAQLVLRLTAPGVPDLYQGSESWVRTLVDPDNRAPIDRERLGQVVTAAVAATDAWSCREPKAAVISRVLAARRRHASCFAPGSRYVPLRADGTHPEHVVAFSRTETGGGSSSGVITVAARFPLSRPDGWAGTTLVLPPGRWRDVLSGVVSEGRVELADLLGAAPASVLEPDPHPG